LGKEGEGDEALPDFSPDPIQNLKHTAFVDMLISQLFVICPSATISN